MDEVEKQVVLIYPEAEAYVEAIQSFDIASIGSKKWFLQTERISKLAMQAVLNATSKGEEIIKELLVSTGKIPVLIQELIAVQIWREKIFSELVKMNFKPSTTLPLYMVLYHEATLMTLLETVLYHQEALESADDQLIDLIDYCCCRVTWLIAREGGPLEISEDITSSEMRELVEQEDVLGFDTAIKATSILSFAAINLNNLPLGVTHQILTTHDVPLLMTNLLNNPPWIRNKDGKTEKYDDGKWNVVDSDNYMKLSKTEGQVWMCTTRLLLDTDCQNKYVLNGYKKEQILKLRSHLHDVMIDQLPFLEQLQRFLEYLSYGEPPDAKPDLIIEQVSEIKEKLLKQGRKGWIMIAKTQAKHFFSPSAENIQEQAKRLSDTYSFDVLESMIQEKPKCAVCGLTAPKRCSRCKNEWYCKRECQVKHWPKHQPACQLLAQEN